MRSSCASTLARTTSRSLFSSPFASALDLHAGVAGEAVRVGLDGVRQLAVGSDDEHLVVTANEELVVSVAVEVGSDGAAGLPSRWAAGPSFVGLAWRAASEAYSRPPSVTVRSPEAAGDARRVHASLRGLLHRAVVLLRAVVLDVELEVVAVGQVARDLQLAVGVEVVRVAVADA